MKLVTVVGARPQFIKAATISRLIKKEFSNEIDEHIIHTGQHYDSNMSKVFFKALKIPTPKVNLKISNSSHGEMTGRMILKLEEVFLKKKYDALLVYGDTNSTLSASIAASKIHLPIIHVEAGLRSFNMSMPEEINRILTDRVSSLLFCPTSEAMKNLKKEGLSKNSYNVGDVMYDASKFYSDLVDTNKVLKKFNLDRDNFILATIHREENTNNTKRLLSIINSLRILSEKYQIIFPIHPRTKKFIKLNKLEKKFKNIKLVDPLDYLDMVALEKTSRVIITDSGGVQKEAFFFGKPCITVRNETEWVETVQLGWNKLTGANKDEIINGVESFYANYPKASNAKPYGNGHAAEKIIKSLRNHF